MMWAIRISNLFANCQSNVQTTELYCLLIIMYRAAILPSTIVQNRQTFADYVVIMGYDEHNGSSLEAGSVSSYEFVKEGIEETIKEVPAEKVINGIPFFTRLWSETPKTQEELNQEAGTEAADYPMKVTSEALGMSTARDKISQAGAETTLDETTGNNYATWEADGVTYEIWLEDATSIEPKLQLMKENKLAGTAAWALGQESPDIWDLILKYVN